jgi:hypothetical protein
MVFDVCKSYLLTEFLLSIGAGFTEHPSGRVCGSQVVMVPQNTPPNVMLNASHSSPLEGRST